MKNIELDRAGRKVTQIEARLNAMPDSSNVGDKSNLNTTNKNTIVEAINEINNKCVKNEDIEQTAGMNILKNTQFRQIGEDILYWKAYSPNENKLIIYKNTNDNSNCVRIVNTVSGTNKYTLLHYTDVLNFAKNKNYVFSFKIRSYYNTSVDSATIRMRIGSTWVDLNTMQNYKKTTEIIDASYIKVNIKFSTSSDVSVQGVVFGVYGIDTVANNTGIGIKEPSLQAGAIASEYSPSNLDYIENVNGVAKNLKSEGLTLQNSEKINDIGFENNDGTLNIKAYKLYVNNNPVETNVGTINEPEDFTTTIYIGNDVYFVQHITATRAATAGYQSFSATWNIKWDSIITKPIPSATNSGNPSTYTSGYAVTDTWDEEGCTGIVYDMMNGKGTRVYLTFFAKKSGGLK